MDGSESDLSLAGVRGWLLFFCINLVILSPVVSLIFLYVGYNGIGEYAYLFPRLVPVATIDSVATVAIVLFGIYTGVGLWRVRDGAVRVAKTYLIVNLAYGFAGVILQIVSIYPLEIDSSYFSDMAQSAVRATIFTAIWYSYLNRSRRVHATYGT